MAIRKLTLEVTFSQIEELVTALREVRDERLYMIRNEDWQEKTYWKNPETDVYEVNPNVPPEVKRTSIEAAERELERRAKYNRLISLITGESVDDSEYEDRVAEGRRLLDAQEKAKPHLEVVE